MVKNRWSLDSGFVLRHPLVYVFVLVLAILPHYIVDYQTCYLVVKQTNPEASLLGFIRHVLIEKSLISLMLTIMVLATVYLLDFWISRADITQFSNQVKHYFLRAALLVIISSPMYAMLHLVVLSFFPSHHGELESGLYTSMMIYHSTHYALIFSGLVFINLIKSSIKKPVAKLEVQDMQGKCIVDVSEIDWVVKTNGIYELKTKDRTFRTELSINYFEQLLNRKHYVRINRAAIVKQQLIKGYNYWEHDKYILRVGEESKEFVVSRARMKTIRNRLA